jgi:hypothetical protein
MGVRIAIPKALMANQDCYDYEKSPYYILGLYDGEPAYLITLYMDDREDICQVKDLAELLCDPSLGQEAFIVTKTSEIPLFKHQEDALVT